jgi:flagellin
MQTSMERLSSGLRINSAADDAAGLAVANKMQSQLGGIKMAIRNSQDGVSLVQTADGALDEISKLIRRMRELAVQMQNGIYTNKDRSNAQMEIKALLAEVDKIASNTQYNKVNLLDGTYDETIRAGNTNAETIRINIGSLKTADNAIIEAHAVEKAVAGTVAANGTSSALNVTEATSVVVDTSVFSTAFATVFNSDSLGTFSIAAHGGGVPDDTAHFSIDAKTGKVTSVGALDREAPSGGAASGHVYTFNVEYRIRGVAAGSAASHVEEIALTVTDKANTQLDDLKIETAADAGRAIETLDKALEEVSTAQAKLGASQNRLTHNIDNLSKGSMLTEQSVGRIMDADFAVETSELSKQQILSQAAMAMLAQANVSKQAVMALLR